MIPFHPLTLSDGVIIRSMVEDTECRNCDLNFINLMSWRFLYDTEVAFHKGWLLFRFKANGHNAYLSPVGKGDWTDIIQELLTDALEIGQPFLMLGVCESSLNYLNDAMPNYFFATADRSYTDYLYKRTNLALLPGKKLHQKRNHINKFIQNYPDYEYLPLTEDLIPECLKLRTLWETERDEDPTGRLSFEAEKKSIEYVFRHWKELEARGGVLKAKGQIIAFTYGGIINYDTFDICAEKADIRFDGAYAMINKEFAAHLPENFIYLNREEDLGLEGLRKAKESYKPEILLHKFSVMAKHPLGDGETER